MIIKLASGIEGVLDALKGIVGSHASQASEAVTSGATSVKNLAQDVINKVKADPELQKHLTTAATHTAAAGAGFAAGTAREAAKNTDKLKTLIPAVAGGGLLAGIAGTAALKHKKEK